MKKYAVLGIENCQVFFDHSPVNGPGSDIFRFNLIALKLVMWPYNEPGEQYTDFIGPVKETLISFLNVDIDKVVQEESLDYVSITMPLKAFEDFYKNLSEALTENKFTVTMTTNRDSGRNVPDFNFKGE